MYFQKRICKQGVCFRVKIKFSCSTYSKIATGPILENSFGIFFGKYTNNGFHCIFDFICIKHKFAEATSSWYTHIFKVTVLHQVSVRYLKYFVSRIHETKSQQQLKTVAFTSELRVIPA